jgi:hypothetical protein
MRVSDKFLSAVDRWRRKQDDLPSRSEAVRRLVEATLHILAKDPGEKPARKAGSRAGRAKASELAGQAIDRLGDKSAPDEEQARRKRRLIKGPQEFRDVRADLPKPKG